MKTKMTARWHPLVGFFALALMPIFILVDAGAAFARGWRPEGRLDALVVYAAEAVLALAFLGLVLRRLRGFLGACAARLFVLVTCGLGTWLLLEGVLEGFQYGTDMPYYAPNMRRVLRPAPGILPGVSGEQRFTTNSRGARGPELPAERDVYRILCVGGSTTECLYLDDEKVWPHLLMGELERGGRRCWVGNVGMAGKSSVEHRTVVEASDLMGDVDCVLVLAGINDLFRALKGVSISQIEGGPLWSRSRVLGLVRKVWHTSTRSGTLVQDDTGKWLQDARLQRRKGRVIEECPELEGHLREYAEQLRLICEACRRRNVRLVFVSQPVLWDKNLSAESHGLLWMGRTKDPGTFLSVPQLREAMDRYNEVLRAVCGEEGVGFVDLSPMNGRLEFFYDEAHFNEAGCRHVAQAVARWFLDNPPRKVTRSAERSALSCGAAASASRRRRWAPIVTTCSTSPSLRP